MQCVTFLALISFCALCHKKKRMTGQSCIKLPQMRLQPSLYLYLMYSKKSENFNRSVNITQIPIYCFTNASFTESVDAILRVIIIFFIRRHFFLICWIYVTHRSEILGFVKNGLQTNWQEMSFQYFRGALLHH